MKKDATKEIRKHYVELLAGLEVNSKSIPVFNLAKVNSKPPYILIFGGTSENNDTKNGFSDNITVNVQVHTSFTGDFGGEEFADDVVNEIIERRYDQSTPGVYGSTENFNIITCTRNIQEAARIETPTSVHILRQIQFSHFIEQIKI